MSPYQPYIVALYVAAALAGIYFIRVHIVLNGGGDHLANLCILSPATRASIYAVQYLPAGLTGFLCTLSEFFLGALEPNTPGWRTAVECIGALAVPIAAGWLEASRGKPSLWVALPVLWGLGYQAVGGGVVLVLQLLAIILTSDAPSRIRHGQIARADAEGALLGVLLGYIAPTVYLVLRPGPVISAAWQPFPVYVSLIQLLYSQLRRLVTPKGAKLDGYWTTQATYVISALPGLAAHLRVVANIINSTNFIKQLQALFIPSIINLPPGSSLNAAAAHLFKWDSALMYGAALAAPLWLSFDLGKGLEPPMMIAFVQAVPAFGPGPVMAAAWIWREKGLRETRKELELKELTEKALEGQEKEGTKAIKASTSASAVEGSGSGSDTPLRRSKRNRSKRVD
ncbi:hypothetical protein CALVIDRAFT_539120 [Calocera viscosa TUFC12733]|uniref:Uncharacterized protein n=1 Tax=Calocera viscosa (strain TUFC12733) TaxID=1330018 RepID=A0A167K8J2_CALVF|nr:hypothetical protein CALVIDRAFT_539120 [Calocera viscosa TUFC12733]